MVLVTLEHFVNETFFLNEIGYLNENKMYKNPYRSYSAARLLLENHLTDKHFGRQTQCMID